MLILDHTLFIILKHISLIIRCVSASLVIRFPLHLCYDLLQQFHSLIRALFRGLGACLLVTALGLAFLVSEAGGTFGLGEGVGTTDSPKAKGEEKEEVGG